MSLRVEQHSKPYQSRDEKLKINNSAPNPLNALFNEQMNEDDKISSQEKENNEVGYFSSIMDHPVTKLVGGIAIGILVGLLTDKVLSSNSESLSNVENDESSFNYFSDSLLTRPHRDRDSRPEDEHGDNYFIGFRPGRPGKAKDNDRDYNHPRPRVNDHTNKKNENNEKKDPRRDGGRHNRDKNRV